MTRPSRRRGPEVAAQVSDPGALVRALESNERFRRDSRLGRIFHPGMISFRELCRTDSLHITVRGNQVSAHLDEVCPLNFNGRSWHYSMGRVMAHNLTGLLSEARRWIRHPGTRQRCTLECEAVWVDEESIVGLVCDPHHDPDPPGAPSRQRPLTAPPASPSLRSPAAGPLGG